MLSGLGSIYWLKHENSSPWIIHWVDIYSLIEYSIYHIIGRARKWQNQMHRWMHVINICDVCLWWCITNKLCSGTRLKRFINQLIINILASINIILALSLNPIIYFSAIWSWWLLLSLMFLWPSYLFWSNNLGFCSISFADTRLPGCLSHWICSLNIGLNMLLSDSFKSCLDFLLGYYTGEFKAFKPIVRVMFGAMDEPLASCMLVHSLETQFEMIMCL